MTVAPALSAVSEAGALAGRETMHLMAGGGGDLVGFAQAGAIPTSAVNHFQPAIDTIRAFMPSVHGVVEDVARIRYQSLPRAEITIGSPICREVAPAGRRSTTRQYDSEWEATRATAWCLLRAAEATDPLVVGGENVHDFATRWVLFEPWLRCWEALGYDVHLTCVNAAHLSGPENPPAPQNRERLLFLFVKRQVKACIDLEPRPEAICPACGPVHGVRVWRPKTRHVAGHPIGPYKRHGQHGSYFYRCPRLRCGRPVDPVTVPMAPGIDWSQPMRHIRDGRPDRRVFTPYVANTRARIQAGLDAHPDGSPFVVICRNHSTFNRLDGPVAAITAGGNHHMLIRPGPDHTVDGCQARMFTTEEKAFAQRFPELYPFATGGVKGVGGLLTGNAVSVNTAKWFADRIGFGLAA